MADTKLSGLAASLTVDQIYGQLGGTSKAITPFNIVGPIVTKTVDYAVLAADTHAHFNNAGAVAAVVFTLPAAAIGLRYTFTTVAAQLLTIKAVGDDQLAFGEDNSAAAGTMSNATPFGSVTIEAHSASQWVVTSATGTWTVT